MKNSLRAGRRGSAPSAAAVPRAAALIEASSGSAIRTVGPTAIRATGTTIGATTSISALPIGTGAGARQTRDGGDITWGSRSAGGCFGKVRSQVGAGAEERFEDGGLVADFDGVVGCGNVIEGIRDLSLDSGARWGVIALDLDLREGGKVVAILHVVAGPVDEATTPFDSSFAIGGKTSRPQRQLDARRCLGVVKSVGGGVPSIRLLHRADLFAIN